LAGCWQAGKVQLPKYLSINLTDGKGKTRLFQFTDKNHSRVAGRVDDYVVPLRVGSMFTLPLRLDQFWCQETMEFEMKLLPGENRLTAQFEGRGAKYITLDMPGIKLTSGWAKLTRIHLSLNVNLRAQPGTDIRVSYSCFAVDFLGIAVV